MSKIILISILLLIIETTQRRVGESDINQFQCIKSICKQELQNCIQDDDCFSVIQLCNKDFDDCKATQNMKNCLDDENSSNKYIQCVKNKCLKKLNINFGSN
ncbi:unnamed protein product [Paramecium pentaurelia]|uniref:Transmembrane protein n=1 Tax=Paramecium pentaurelia TaxID=43138 RepID=A0A8S1WLI7_9CILI|nr:unnamed protein product [Paramecium pentaurelia]